MYCICIGAACGGWCCWPCDCGRTCCGWSAYVGGCIGDGWYDGGAALPWTYDGAGCACETVGVARGEECFEAAAEEGVTCRECERVCCRHSCWPLARSARPIAPWSPEC